MTRKRKTPKQIAASRRNLEKARRAKKSGGISPDLINGSGTGFSSAWRYLPSVQKHLKERISGTRIR